MTAKNLNYIIIDDDDFARETLEDLLTGFSNLYQIKSLSDSSMAIKHLATLKPDLVFLDVNMPKKSGMDIQQEILDLNLSTKVIFTTAHEEFVLEAFKKNAFDYLIKPIKRKDLEETIARVLKDTNHLKEENSNSTNEIVIKNAFGSVLFKCEEILYIEADGGYSKIHLTSGKHELISKNIGKIEARFNQQPFYKISRSHIINLDYLKKTDRLNKKVILKHLNQNVTLKVSRERFYDLEQLIN